MDEDDYRRLGIDLSELPDTRKRLATLRQLSKRQHSVTDEELIGSELLAVAESVGDPGSLANGHHAIGVSLFRRGEFLKAREHFLAAHSLYEAAKEPEGYIAAIGNLGNVHVKLGEFRAGLEHIQQASDLAREHDLPAQRAWWLAMKGAAHTQLCEYESASECYERSIEHYRAIGDRLMVVRIKENMAVMQVNCGNVRRGLGTLKEAAAEAGEIEHPEALALVESKLGGTYVLLGEVEEGVEHLETARRLCTEYRLDAELLQVLSNLAAVASSQGKLGEALETFQNVLRLRLAMGSGEVAATHANIGDILRRQGNFARAIEHLNAALDAAEVSDDRLAVVHCSGALGLVFDEIGDYSAAIRYFESARTLARDVASPSELARFTECLGVTLYRLDRYDEAMTHFAAALELYTGLEARSDIAHCLGNIGEIHLRRREYTEAKDRFETAITMLETFGYRSEIGRWRLYLGRLYSQTEFREHDLLRAESLMCDGLALVEEAGEKPQAREGHGWLATMYADSGRWKEAHEHLLRCNEIERELDRAEANRQAQFVEHQRRLARVEAERAAEAAEAKAASLRAQLLEAQLDRKQRELTATALHLARQTELLGRFRNDLRRLVRTCPDPSKLARELQEKLRELPCDAIDWTKFEAEFQQTYPDYERKLLERHPDLTKMEVRICVLLRLRLTSLDIAQLLCKSERNIEWHRGNIRRKLALERGDDLVDALAAVE